MNLEISKINWFPTEVYSCVLDEEYYLPINNLVEEEKNNWNKNLSNVQAKTSGWDGLKYKPVQDLSDFAINKILPSIGELSKWKNNNWITRQAWINFYQKGDTTKMHNHFFVDFCAVLITKTTESSLRFVNPLAVHSYYKTRFETQNFSEIVSERNGLFIFFPSYLMHEVIECQSDRISVAFNFENV